MFIDWGWRKEQQHNSIIQELEETLEIKKQLLVTSLFKSNLTKRLHTINMKSGKNKLKSLKHVCFLVHNVS